jgi:hypothetical protein
MEGSGPMDDPGLGISDHSHTHGYGNGHTGSVKGGDVWLDQLLSGPTKTTPSGEF